MFVQSVLCHCLTKLPQPAIRVAATTYVLSASVDIAVMHGVSCILNVLCDKTGLQYSYDLQYSTISIVTIIGLVYHI